MISKEAFKKIDWLIGQNISKLKFDKKCNSTNEMVSCLLIIQQDLEKLEKQDKALEIIKEKNVDVIFLRESENLNEYMGYNFFNRWKWLTQEEYDLLKEVFNSGK